MDIEIPKEFGVKWRGRFLRPSRHAIREMFHLGLSLHDLVEILEEGLETGNPRSKGVVERYVIRGKKIIKVVLMESYAHDIDEYVWMVRHVGGR